jgi:predicted transporter
MSTEKRPSLLVSLLKAPFYLGFLFVLYILGRSCFAQINNFALSLGFPAVAVKASAYVFSGLFFFICAIVLINLFSRND